MSRADAGAGLVERVRQRLVTEGRPAEVGEVGRVLRAEGVVLGEADLQALAERVRWELVGVGGLEPLLADPLVTDVLVNGAGEVWVDRGRGLERVAAEVGDEAAVRRLAQRLAARAGRRLDDAHPFMEATVEGRLRVHAVLPPIVHGGPHLSLRTGRADRLSLAGLVAAAGVPPEAEAMLRALVHARLPFLVTGGTGAGKTTLLQALLALVPGDERIVVVEDTPELVPEHPHVVRLTARPANAEGVGAVGLQTLVRQALRMRPDRLVVGEARGSEVVDLLAALNTGHEGGCATLHANAPSDVPARVEALATGAGLGRSAAHSLLAAAVRVVLHLRRGPGGRRQLAEIAVLGQSPSGLAQVLPAWRAEGSTDAQATATLRHWLAQS